MNTKVILIVLTLSMGFGAQAQLELPTIVSPEAYSFQKFGTYDVNYKTGTPNIEIPIYSFSANGLTIPISLRYHASGIRVTEQATCVGLGWDLGAGGRITRQVKGGVVDESGHGQLMAGAVRYYDDPPTHLSSQVEQDYFNDIAFGIKDTQPDLFTISAPGLNASFYLDSTANVHFTKGEDYQLECNLIIQLLPMVVINEVGTRYKFNKYEETDFTDWYAKRTFEKHSWVLTEIEFTNGEKILFSYHDPIDIVDQMIDFTATVSDNVGIPLGCPSGPNAPVASSLSTARVEQLYLKDITFKNTNVHFAYDQTRQDGTGWRLSTVDVNHKRSGQFVRDRRCELDNNHYFVRDQFPVNALNFQTNATHTRSLKLVGAKFYDTGLTEVYDYSVTYNEAVALPVRTSLARDHYGFYNGQSNASLIPSIEFRTQATGDMIIGDANREISEAHAKAGIIESITYPTGGKSVFEFESNTAGIKESAIPTSQNFIVEGKSVNDQSPVEDRMEQIVVVNEDWSNVEFKYSFSGYAQMIATPEIWFYEDGLATPLVHVIHTVVSQEDIGKYSGGTVQLLNSTKLDKQKQYLLIMDLKGAIGVTDHILDPNTIRSNITVEIVGISDDAERSQSLELAGGVRISSITSQDSNGDILSRKEFSYGSAFGTSSLPQQPSHANLFTSLDYYNMKLSAPSMVQAPGSGSQPMIDCPGGIKIYSFNSNPLKYGVEGLIPFVEYSYVREDNRLSTGEIGAAKEYIYSVPEAEVFSWSGLPNAFKIYYPHYKSSHMLGDKSLTVENGHDRLIQEVKYEYAQTPIYELNTIDVVKKAIFIGGIHGYYADEGLLEVSYPQVTIGTKNLISKKIINYENLELSSKETYQYDHTGNNLLSSKSMTTSDGRVQSTEYRYPQNYSGYPDTPLDKMVDKNMLAIPIEVISKLDGNVTSAIGAEYEHLSTDDLLMPKRIYQYESTIPGANFTASMDGQNFNNAYEKKEVILKRDDKGNVLSHQKEDDVVVTYIWGYDQSYPVAKIENATVDEVNNILILGSNLNVTNALSASQESTLRTHATMAKAMITTYTYKVGIGIETMTYPNGLISKYDYDDFGRLRYIKDVDDNILQTYEYSYSQPSN